MPITASLGWHCGRRMTGSSSSSSSQQIKTGTQQLSYRRLIIIVVAAAGIVLYAMQGTWARRLVYLDEEGWQTAPGYMISPRDFKISPAGVVWSIESGVGRLDGNQYEMYRDGQFGNYSHKKPRGGVAFRNQEVWVAHEEGVLRFDGQHWRLFREALRTSRPESIAANAAGVWVVDDSGNLSHFDGASWTISDLNKALPEAKWSGIIVSSHPALALTADGVLWIAWQGLWRFDGRNWKEARPGGSRAQDVTLVGPESHRLWLLHATGILEAVGESGDVTAHYTPADLNLSPKNRITAVAADGNEIYVGTSEGLFVLFGGRCRRIAGPDDTPVVAKVAVAPGGSVWAIVDQVPGLPGYFNMVWNGPLRWAVFLGYWILASLMAAGVTLLSWRPTVVTVVAVLSMMLKAAMETWGRYSISVEDSIGTVFSGIGTVGSTSRFSIQALHSVRIKEAARQSIFIQHQIVLEAEQRISFGDQLKDQHLCYIAIFLLNKRLVTEGVTQGTIRGDRSLR